MYHGDTTYAVAVDPGVLGAGGWVYPVSVDFQTKRALSRATTFSAQTNRALSRAAVFSAQTLRRITVGPLYRVWMHRRKSTLRFIELEPLPIYIQRYDETEGDYVTSSDPQTVRWIQRGSPGETPRIVGEAMHGVAGILCTYDADVERGDRFEDRDGNLWEITFVHTWPYKIECGVKVVG